MPIRCYSRSTIVEVATRDLRNKTADLLKRVEAGESIVITVRGKPVADLVPHRSEGPRWLGPDEVMEIVTKYSADPGLRDDLKRLDETTDEDRLNRLW
ncbi:MAG TPA: type II toxin-antitoxin system prevent-host-death family antitoxin [Solirubrobacterales bacterium]|nr:type II toxin-antitoxin system prevent-host-death family antitoxin [Solirubrobacterales bacterium]